MTEHELCRFEMNVVRDDGGCWSWTASTSGGYGDFMVGGKRTKAHIAAYEHCIGPVPDGMELDHLCRNRACCNPEHLEPVTHQVNVLRGEGIAAVNARKTECKRGHSLAGDNLGINPTSGTRFCRICAQETKRAYQARRRAKQT